MSAILWLISDGSHIPSSALAATAASIVMINSDILFI
jgi:hypothetical protein